ncbi:MAG TPA: site-specific DNA-methyltransferase [Symbiobacteriaceae bacterium]|nr:site-specific DNA-methyltransferase [Symbiobacteriaceae bacterium]
MTRRTQTKAYGSSKREGHDASAFYNRSLYGDLPRLLVEVGPELAPTAPVPAAERSLWANRIYGQTAEAMTQVPDGAVGLAFTSPPYNAGKEYDANLDLSSYLQLIERVGREVHRVLQPGGRYVVNVANLGRKPYIPLHAYFHAIHARLGFLPMGEIIWKKGRGMSNNCAWGSWRSARNPVLRDLHEYLLVFAKEQYARPDRGESTLTGPEFMAATLSVWEIPPASAKKVGHPAPFPGELADRVIRLFSYAGDVVLDPFAGSGTTCVAACQSGRDWVGYEIEPAYCALAERNLRAVTEGAGPGVNA